MGETYKSPGQREDSDTRGDKNLPFILESVLILVSIPTKAQIAPSTYHQRFMSIRNS